MLSKPACLLRSITQLWRTEERMMRWIMSRIARPAPATTTDLCKHRWSPPRWQQLVPEKPRQGKAKVRGQQSQRTPTRQLRKATGQLVEGIPRQSLSGWRPVLVREVGALPRSLGVNLDHALQLAFAFPLGLRPLS